jgi:hypothetical protein
MNRDSLISGYIEILEEEDTYQYETPYGTTFARNEKMNWYNYDNPNEKLSVKQLAIRCADEEMGN